MNVQGFAMVKSGAKSVRLLDNKLDPVRISRHELSFIPAKTAQCPCYVVQVDGLRAGLIRHARLGATRKWWTWTLNGPFMPQHLFPDNGRADSFEGAKIAFHDAFMRWLKWALAQDDLVLWQGADSTARISSELK